MNKKKVLFFFLFCLVTTGCSFDTFSGIWGDPNKEKKRAKEIELRQQSVLDIIKIYSTEDEAIYDKEVNLTKNIKLSSPDKNSSWEMSGLTPQNLLGNIYLPSINNRFLKKKVGKNKLSILKIKTSILLYQDQIIFTDTIGNIFKITQNGQIIWKINIYNKIYKNINKKLNLSVYKNHIYISDNVGFVYSVNFETGKIIWVKNNGISLKSNIKIFKDKIFLIDQDNKIICFSTTDGSKLWQIRSISSFIKSQNLLSLAITNEGNLIALTSSADLFKINIINGDVFWSSNTSSSLFVDASDFFESSSVVVSKNDIFFSSGNSFFSFNEKSGGINWETKVSSVDTPVVSGANIFFMTKNGYFIIVNKENGKIISAKNILKVLKERKRNTVVTGFVMGSNKMYSTTLNGFLIVSSANTGNVEYFKKIGDAIISSPAVSKGKLFILTEKSRILGFN